LQGIYVTFNEVSRITKCQNIDEGPQLSQGGWSGKDVVGCVQRPWGIHIDMVRNRGSKEMDGCPLASPPLQGHGITMCENLQESSRVKEMVLKMAVLI
jgi:hypothetical protein